MWSIDRDPAAVERAQFLKQEFIDRFQIAQAPFSTISNVFSGCPFDAVLFDLGASSDQVANS